MQMHGAQDRGTVKAPVSDLGEQVLELMEAVSEVV